MGNKEKQFEKDSPLDTPATVEALSSNKRQVRALQGAFSGQHLWEELPDGKEVYIWRQADAFIKRWLKRSGFYLLESDILDDCVGYLCTRNGCGYALYMYAYGNEKTSQLDAEYCGRLKNHPYAEGRTILITYLHVERFINGDKTEYSVHSYNGNESAELWLLTEINGEPIIQYYPGREMIDRTYELMYAFNHSSLDVYDNIISKKNPSFSAYGSQGTFFNGAVYHSLQDLRQKYGCMKTGYVRYNDVVYSQVPYLDNYGFFGFSTDDENRITEIRTYPFEGCNERQVRDFIKTDEREREDMFSYVPGLIRAEAMMPVTYERFALKLLFDNGECRKFVLPISGADENDEAVKYAGHVFTDKIWASVKIVNSVKSLYNGYPPRGQAVKFKNDFTISVLYMYQNSRDYTEPIHCGGTVYEDDGIEIKSLWKWNAKAMYIDGETGLIKTLVSGDAFNTGGVSTFADLDGHRIAGLDFDYIDDFSEGLALIGIDGRGYGYIDASGKIVISAKYDFGGKFHNGKANVIMDNKWYFIDKSGNETPFGAPDGKRYEEVGNFSEGLCRVSTLKLRFMDLAYHTDDEFVAGTWGYVDKTGREIIPPQYIFAYDFRGGTAIVCKGKWTRDIKWDEEHKEALYWTEEELWGSIDKTGKEVIPFIFDEIKEFGDTDGVYMAHTGGWENGKWCVIDDKGNRLTEPIFEDIGYEYKDGLFTFYETGKWSDDDIPLGIYDINRQKVLFEPQFLDVEFLDDGNINVEVYDEKLGRDIEKIIDRNGKELFPSVYSSIYEREEMYEVSIRDENGLRKGLIDKNGNIILPCKHDVVWGGICYDKRRMIFNQDKKQGIMDFDDNIIVPAVYNQIRGIDEPLLTVCDGEKGNYSEGLIKHDGTKVIEPKYKNIIWYNDSYILCSREGGCEVLQLIRKNKR